MIVSLLLGCTVAKPPDTIERESTVRQTEGYKNKPVRRTEEFLCRVTGLDDLDDAGTESLNARYVVGEDTHVTSSCSQVDLDGIGGRVDGLAELA